MNCAGILFEEANNDHYHNPCIAVCRGTLSSRQDGLVQAGLEVDSDFAAVNVSNLTEDSNIGNNTSYNHNMSDNDDNSRSNNPNDQDKDMKSRWLSSVLQRRKAKEERHKKLDALSKNARGSGSTPTTLGTMDESFSYSSSSNGGSSCEDDDADKSNSSHSEASASMDDEDGREAMEAVSTKRSRIPKHTLKLNLDEYDDEQFQSAIEDLKGRTDLITKLEVYCNSPGCRSQSGGGTTTRSLSDLGTFFSEVGGLAKLQELVLWNFNPDCSWILTCFLKERPPALKSFRLHHARGSMSKDLLKALVQVPTLTDMVLEMQHDFPLDILFSSSSLRKLKINGLYNIGQKNFAHAMKMLCRNNRTLQVLDVKPTIATSSIRDLCDAVEQNQTLEKLQFSIRAESIEASGEALIELAKALSQNHSLKQVVNRNHQSIQVTHDNSMFAHGFLETNTSLERFQFYNEQACVEGGDEDTNDDDFTRDSLASAARASSEQLASWLVACGDMDALCQRK